MAHRNNMKKKEPDPDIEEKRKRLTQQMEAAVWLQAIGQISEAILLLKLYLLSDNQDSAGEKTLLTGAWIQAAGQLLEALGVTEEGMSQDEELILEGQKTVVAGDFLQGIGGLLAALGGTEVLEEEHFQQIHVVP